ncbi:MAG: PD-(D/E)XK nuclease family protein [Candidatus Woesearchaeota archaeon]|jgi:CRISPR/Cas system-associated exonuclease Cas4 (RecB family)|nr:PD-(D/E)XK nuclease family protein [Candidatus Woesearchaeota archaeon]MDP7198146.1 PD-(D/E)XK nuclease family protein [Candidatus Woesearchaeota archaeon]MDP7466980.1 PD-(D/E)XK nuclease family protein [Candidatus Woesearchaeota archaeon]MDP7646651.1 PD-(D/E)XK nuclease family protein [Candidatus Woesearchaeota archaeon]
MDKVLKEYFDTYMKKDKLPPELAELKGYSLFTDEELLKAWRNNRKGIEYVDKASGAFLHGAIDNMLTKGKKLVVLDYKTRGYPLKEDTASHYQAQMDAYNYLLRKNGYETEDYAFLLFYYPLGVDKDNIQFAKELIKMKTDVKNAEKLFKAAIKICQQENSPSPNPECKFCEYRAHQGQ